MCSSVCGTSSHTAVFVGKRKITKNLVVKKTTRPHFLVVLTYFLVAEDATMLEFCYPDMLHLHSQSR